MKKYNKTAHVHRLRVLLREVMLLVYGHKCARCGKEDSKIDTSHIFPKGTYKTMQFLVENVKPLCYYCHQHFWHANPIKATAWVKEYLGKEKYAELQKKTLTTNTFNRTFLDQEEIRLKELRAEILGGL